MSSEWTLDGELIKLTRATNVVSALTALGIADAGGHYELKTIRDWHRSGSETYNLYFEVRTARQRLKLVLKACVAYGAGQPLKEIFASWLSRRRRLERLGVGTPKLLGVGDATLVEEYIEHDLCYALEFREHRMSILDSLGRTAGLVVSAGFQPISAHDWRSRGDDVVLVDFGQDLGPPDMRQFGEGDLLVELLRHMDNAGINLSASELRLIGSSYELGLRGSGPTSDDRG